MTKTYAIFIGLLGVQLCDDVSAQTPIAPLKSAVQLVSEYASLGTNPGDRGVVRGLFWKGCPSADARRDSIFSELIRLEATSVQVLDMAISFAGNMKNCRDPRLDGWFQKQIGLAKEPGVIQALTQGLLFVNPTPANVQAAKGVAFNPEAQDEVRMLVLNRLIHESDLNLDARQRVDLLAEVYVKSGRIPEPYHTSEVAFLTQSFHAGYWRDQLTNALLEHPQNFGAIELLQHLGTDAIFEDGGANALWALRFREAMVRLENDARAPLDVRKGAQKTRQLLDNRKRLDLVR